MNFDQFVAYIQRYGRLIASLALLIFILITIANLFGVTLFPVKTFGAQETGVLVAALAYALRG